MLLSPSQQQSRWWSSEQVSLSKNRRQIVWERPYEDVQTWDVAEMDVLTAFVALAQDRDDLEALGKFARRYGPLLLCEHGLPRTHLSVRDGMAASEESFFSHQAGRSHQRLRVVEEVAAWHEFISEAAAMVTIAELLHSNSPAEPTRWTALRRLLPDVSSQSNEPLMETEQPLDVQRRALAYAVQRWLDWSDVGLTYSWDSAPDDAKSTGPQVRLGGSTLFGCLALSLAMRTSSSPEVLTCAGCQEPFLGRQRQAGKLAWCDKEECRRAKNRDEVRRWRARNRRN